MKMTKNGTSVVRSVDGVEFELNKADFSTLVRTGIFINNEKRYQIFQLLIKKIADKECEIEDIGLLKVMLERYISLCERDDMCGDINHPKSSLELLDEVVDEYVRYMNTQKQIRAKSRIRKANPIYIYWEKTSENPPEKIGFNNPMIGTGYGFRMIYKIENHHSLKNGWYVEMTSREAFDIVTFNAIVNDNQPFSGLPIYQIDEPEYWATYPDLLNP